MCRPFLNIEGITNGDEATEWVLLGETTRESIYVAQTNIREGEFAETVLAYLEETKEDAPYFLFRIEGEHIELEFDKEYRIKLKVLENGRYWHGWLVKLKVKKEGGYYLNWDEKLKHIKLEEGSGS